MQLSTLIYQVNEGIEFYELKNYKAAIDCFNKAIIIDSNNLEAYFNKGISLSFLNKDEESRENYNKAFEINKINALNMLR